MRTSLYSSTVSKPLLDITTDLAHDICLPFLFDVHSPIIGSLVVRPTTVTPRCTRRARSSWGGLLSFVTPPDFDHTCRRRARCPGVGKRAYFDGSSRVWYKAGGGLEGSCCLLRLQFPRLLTHTWNTKCNTTRASEGRKEKEDGVLYIFSG